MNNIQVMLKSGKEISIRRMHPWVFSGAIKSMSGNVEEGDLVDVFSNHGEFLGTGHCQPGTIAVRMLTFSKEEINSDFWTRKIRDAVQLRERLGFFDNPLSNVFRLVNAEGDMMPGLVVDFYNGTAIMQMHSVGMYLVRKQLAEILKEVLGDHLKCIYDKSDSTLPFKSGIEAKPEYLLGSPADNMVQENGNTFYIDWEDGQKTGFFIDQRENRKLLGEYSKGRSVLNMFCYTGGFSVYAMREGAKLVHSVDASKKAIELTDKNIEANFANDPRHKSFAEDAFQFFDRKGQDYDLIILDPPAFAKHQKVLDNALQGYKRINREAIEKISPGGILFTFSCSQVVSRDNFRKSVFAAAASSGRTVKILHQLSQPADHPISIYHPEGEYLKGLVLQID
ncbi:MAG: class I SAM-dependent rRNA methyltransferase [Bacteroidales bacterium]|nr:class I SAM-dependent rRNA methyltransferase [Bacteroidales bacterium]